ncbi:retropepsin-like aspartic protease family protein [Jiella sonneratiae]|uniref:TIGR02281 family clan AA aspartic protease n=1 Tax=Jiella sonneratiae TaxID=2816856 RepID=A0ABS3J0M1_9HYPH|nr:TIGR02281 family clan AA aspartic protease [Jiella sonneratiae]MBO0903212.1 TIGR02281 family clan AA aspartic protease [Jiella sonneratiae]
MHNHLILLAIASVAALAAPSLFERYQAEIMSTRPESLDAGPPLVEAAVPAPAAPVAAGSRETRIPGDGAGHFRTEAVMNGRSVPIIVDTGASTVALDEDTARMLGIRLAAGDFVYEVRTANGVARAARAEIGEVVVGQVSLRHVEATVIRDVALPQALLGMSFLGRLNGYSVENGALTLKE